MLLVNFPSFSLKFLSHLNIASANCGTIFFWCLSLVVGWSWLSCALFLLWPAVVFAAIIVLPEANREGTLDAVVSDFIEVDGLGSGVDPALASLILSQSSRN